MKKPELLAPAGDLEKLTTAIHYGADAVYLGSSPFSLRGKAGNFRDRELAEAVSLARSSGVRAYVTVNILPHNRDLGALEAHAELLGRIRPDGVIISDPGVLRLFSRLAPHLGLHISTQANITNTAAARFWEDQGASRLILSRELSLQEIAGIRAATSVELEVFVHGSICISYSGRCYISSFLASSPANTGECTNSCRWRYALMEEKRPGQYLPVFEDDRGTYLMSPRDLCMIAHLPELAAAGVDSFKIEGRMKGINYVGGVVKTYREAVDALTSGNAYNVKEQWARELQMFSSRGYTTGMFFGRHPDNDYDFACEGYRMSHELVGVVQKVEDGSAVVGLRNRIDRGDVLEYLSPGIEHKCFPVDALWDEEGTAITTARNEDRVVLRVPPEVRPRDLIRRRRADFVKGGGQ